MAIKDVVILGHDNIKAQPQKIHTKKSDSHKSLFPLSIFVGSLL